MDESWSRSTLNSGPCSLLPWAYVFFGKMQPLHQPTAVLWCASAEMREFSSYGKGRRVEEFLGRNNSSISILLSFLSPPPVRTSTATFIHPISSYIETGARATTFESPWDCDCLQFAGGKDLCTSSHLVTALQQLPAKRTFLFRFSLYSSRFTEHRERKTPAGSTKNEQSKAALYCWQSLGSSTEARYATLLSHLGFRLSLWKQEC